MITLTYDEFCAQIKAQNVPRNHIALKCPMCGTIQSAQDLINAGAGKNFDEVEKFLGFSCVGRWTHQKPPPPKNAPPQNGCDWTLGGLFQLHNTEIITPDNVKHPRFDIATPEEAQSHAKAM